VYPHLLYQAFFQFILTYGSACWKLAKGDENIFREKLLKTEGPASENWVW
jgi:hypothetical protein